MYSLLLQGLLLLNTRERKIQEWEHWREKMGAQGTMGRGKKWERNNYYMSGKSKEKIKH